MVSRLLKSQSVRGALIFAAGGFGFAAGNIVLAMVLTPASFGVVALLLALNQFGIAMGAFGMEVIVNRHRPVVDRAFAASLLLPALLTSAGMALLAHYYYGLATPIVALAFLLILASIVNRVVASLYQGERKVFTAMALLQVHNYTLLVAAGIVVLFSTHDESLVVGFIAFGYLCTAGLGWLRARTTMTEGRSRIGLRLLLREGASVVGLNVAIQLLFQFERLAIPRVGSMEMLATYAVLTAIAGSPYRMIQAGNTFTLLPRVRAAPDAASARHVIAHEAKTALLVAVLSTLLILACAPVVFHYVLRDRYVIGWSLLAVAICMGAARVCEGFTSTIVSALGSPRRLAQLSAVSWISLAVAVGGVVAGARFGLLGILYGTLAAWVVLAGGGGWLARTSIHERFAPAAP